MTVERAADYTGDLFTVDEGSLQFAAGVKDHSTVCKLTVDGGQAENVTGALVRVPNTGWYIRPSVRCNPSE